MIVDLIAVLASAAFIGLLVGTSVLTLLISLDGDGQEAAGGKEA